MITIGLQKYRLFSTEELNKEEFCKKVDNVRSEMYTIDKEMLKDYNLILSDEFPSVPTGRFTTQNHGVTFDCLFHYTEEYNGKHKF